jgi:hypothetical protein
MFADAVRAAGSPRNTFPVPPHSSYQPRRNRKFFNGWGTEEELETALRAWLLRIIALVGQEEQASSQSA